MDVVRALRIVKRWLLAVAGWIAFRILQVVVAVPFTLLICIQIGVAGIFRAIKPPVTLQKVQAARLAAAAAAAAPRSPTAKQQEQAAGRTADAAPVHVFPDSSRGHESLAWKLVGPYMRQHGRHAIANSQLFNPEYVHFLLPGVGSLPYVLSDVWNRAVVIGTGEPLAPRSDWQRLTEAFLQEYPDAYFYHITEEFAQLLHDMGYYVNGVGTETTLQVQSWSYTAKTRTIRAAARAARQSGVRVRELAPEELTDELRAKLQHDVTGCWMQQKAVADRELRVFVRHVDFDSLQLRDGVRIFVAEAYNPSTAPPAAVDPALQGAALNAKPPKPPRRSRSLAKSMASQSSLRSWSSGNSLSTQPTLGSSGGSNSISPTASAASDGLCGTMSILLPPSVDSCCLEPAPSSDELLPTPLSAGDSSASSASCDSNSSAGSADCLARIGVSRVLAAADGAAAAGAKPGQGLGVSVGAPAEDGRGAGGVLGPELVGFVLLDPLWEAGEEVGYVLSIQRMKRSAHAGTLKLLVEDIVSKMRQEGKRELTFGFAPLFNVNDSTGRRYLHWIRWVSLYLFYCANNVYAFRNLAYSKIRYGAGLDASGMSFNDPNVTLTHVYLATKHYMPGWNILDLYGFFKFVGIIDNPISVFLKLLGVTKGGENLE